MSALFLSLRRRIALTICPELGVAPSVEVSITPRPGLSAVSPETEHLVRLGFLWLAHHRTESFIEACGFPPCPPRRPGGWNVDDGRGEVSRLQNKWRAFVRNPPKGPHPRTYMTFREFFSHRWPDDLPWPSDIPRPEKSERNAA